MVDCNDWSWKNMHVSEIAVSRRYTVLSVKRIWKSYSIRIFHIIFKKILFFFTLNNYKFLHFLNSSKTKLQVWYWQSSELVSSRTWHIDMLSILSWRYEIKSGRRICLTSSCASPSCETCPPPTNMLISKREKSKKTEWKFPQLLHVARRLCPNTYPYNCLLLA